MTKRKKYMRFGLFIFSCSVVLFVSGCKTQQTEVPPTAGPASSRMKQVRVETTEESHLKKEENASQLFKFASQFRKPLALPAEATIKDETNQLRIAYLEATTVPQSLENPVSRSNLTHRHAEDEQKVMLSEVVAIPKSDDHWQSPYVHANAPLQILPRGTVIDPFAYFTVVQGSDPVPVIHYTPVNPNESGYQVMQITAIDSKGKVSVATVTFLFNHSPIIQQVRQSPHITIGSSIDLLAGISAHDEEDGELTSEVQVQTTLQTEQEGSYEVIYSVTDQFGANTKLISNITITNEAPIISGPNQLVLPVDQSFSLFDYFSANDQEDGAINLTSDNILASDLVPYVPGNYFVRIGNVVDRYGKRAAERTIRVHLTNEAPTITNTHMTLPVFSELNKESYLAKLVLADREDPVEQLHVAIDLPFWEKIDTSRLNTYRFPLQVQDTHGELTKTFGSIQIINEPPVFSGIEDKKIIVGEEKPDLLAGISVSDREESIGIEDVEIVEEIAWDISGTYPVYLTVKDTFTETTVPFHVIIQENNPEISEKLSE
ncbi:immunoglobulin-like domain-containing protein [Enterococcus mundtii]|uniref:immunoglobulin-like domain-containing protein n=1 Tax=Enterococcus mundtii TaxID=53346 RepID=UPI002DBD8953|nr:immunoglobulin-like domain-containing protein [Enterococcus mundtii]MEC3941776.1 immunoglobulin-like domain-containing protein [Enterococcus mundtii]